MKLMIFFANEYLLCRELHRYPKPVLAWGNGLIMGGGWGLFAASSHRIVTETAQLAMPEIAIGLFPDVGASSWLHQLADGVGRFLLLTAARLNASDALAAGAADWALPAHGFQLLRDGMTELTWLGQPQADAQMLSQLVDALSGALQPPLPPGHWQPVREQVRALVAGDDLDAILARIDALHSDNVWLQKRTITDARRLTDIHPPGLVAGAARRDAGLRCRGRHGNAGGAARGALW